MPLLSISETDSNKLAIHFVSFDIIGVSYRGLICQLRPNLGEFGVYSLNVTGEGCDMQTTRDPVDIYMRK